MSWLSRVSLLWGLLVCLGSAWAGVQVTDDRGVVVNLPAPPQRIVSLLPSLTEVVCQLDACERLVGVDRYSDWPERVQSLPRLGGGLDPNIEAIVALRPDVVLLATSSRSGERLRSYGIPVVALEPHNYNDVRRVLDKVGALLGASDPQRLWRTVDAGVAAAAQSLPAGVRGTKVYFEVNSGPYGASESSFIGETLARLGVRNVLSASLGPFPKINPEFIVVANPDVIMVGRSEADGLQSRPGWSAIRAVREGRVCRFSPQEADVLVRPGPRMDEAARLMARCLNDKAPGARR